MKYEKKPPPLSDMLRPKDVAKLLGVSVKTLANWRSLGTNLSYHKRGRKIFYLRTDVEVYILRNSTRHEAN